MSRFETSRRAARQNAWAAFVRDGDERALKDLPPALAQSWCRARACGVDPALHSLPVARARPPRSGDFLRRELLNATENFFQSAVGASDKPRLMLILADADGTVIKRSGSRALLRVADRFNIVPGAVASEQFIGTNACAEALYTRQISRVDLYEHYCEAFFEFADIAAPILDPSSGAVLGSLDVVQWKKPLNEQLHLLIKTAVGSFESHLREHAQWDYICLLENLQRQSCGYGAAALLLDDGGVIRAASAECAHWIGGGQSLFRGQAVTSVPELQHLDEETLSEVLRQKSSHPAPIPVTDGEREVLLTRVDSAGASLGGRILVQFRRSDASRGPARRAGAIRPFGEFVGRDPGLLRLLEYAAKVAGTDAPVFITGETGTGKELLARGIHLVSGRSAGPFVAINCGAIGADLAAAELFGYVAGAFTGATRAGREGKFVLADGGTLFLDEITESSPAFQVALLRALQEGEVIPVGSDSPVKVDVRVIAACNRRVDEALQAQQLRHDLYYRLCSLTLDLPPLRDRESDIPLLATHILAGLAPACEITTEALDTLQRYLFPGNVRELQSIMQRAVLVASNNVIQRSDLSVHVLGDSLCAPDTAYGAAELSLHEMECQTIRAALLAHGGNAREAAKALGIPRSTLYRKIARFDLKDLLCELRSRANS
jgi:transcriptional regulator of acetoin/glycerol metabolism